MRQRQGGRLGIAFALVGVIALLLAAGAATFLYGRIELDAVGAGDSVEVTVSAGESLDTLAGALQGEGLIKNSFFFSAYARLRGAQLHAGRYSLDSGMGASEMINVLEGPPNYCAPVTFVIPEGFTVDQIATRIASTKGLNVTRQEYLAAVAQGGYDYSFLDIRPAGDTSLEGFLFPATYTEANCPSARSLVQQQLAAFGQNVAPLLPASATKAYADLITGSIVQAEARFPDDFPQVASVVDNRLAASMDLQIDATVMYGLGMSGEEMSPADEAIDTPYNSYLNRGLPPTPIDNPGVATLGGALAPATTTDLFYFTDPCGHNHYSVTEAQHEAQVAQYQNSC